MSKKTDETSEKIRLLIEKNRRSMVPDGQTVDDIYQLVKVDPLPLAYAPAVETA